MPDGSWDINEWCPYKMTYIGSCWIDLNPVGIDVTVDFMILYPYAKSYLHMQLEQARLN